MAIFLYDIDCCITYRKCSTFKVLFQKYGLAHNLLIEGILLILDSTSRIAERRLMSTAFMECLTLMAQNKL